MLVKEEEITVFTVDMCPNNNYFDTLICKKCIEQAKKVFKKSKFKIYTPEDEIVKQCMNEYKESFKHIDTINKKNEGFEWKSDIVRIYILSKLKNHLYFDSDVYFDDINISVNNSSSIKSMLDSDKNKFYYGSFAIIWNGNDFEIFKKILNFYKDKFLNEIKILSDIEITPFFKSEYNMFERHVQNYHYSEIFMFSKGCIDTKYVQVDKNKLEYIKKIKNKEELFKNIVLTKRFKEYDEIYCGLDVFYWGYVFDTYDEFKDFLYKNKFSNMKLSFI